MRSAAQISAGTKPRTRSTRWNVVDKIALAAFIIWSIAGLIFTVNHITPAAVAHWAIPPALVDFVDLCQRWGDPILILLAFTNTHLHAARQWSDGVARRWGIIVVVCAYGLETLGARTGIPFGDYHYTTLFGPILGAVPLTIPLAWHVVVTNALFIVRALMPHCSRVAEAVLAGFLCTLYDFILEPFATTIKHYWVWADGSVPPMNYITWFVVSALLIGIFAPTISTRHRFDPRPALVFFFTIAIFIAGEFK